MLTTSFSFSFHFLTLFHIFCALRLYKIFLMDIIYDIGVLLVKNLRENVDIILINPLKMGRTLNFHIIFFP